MNIFMLVGRIVHISPMDDNEKKCKMTISVKRVYKNESDIYDTDFIEVELENNIAKNVLEYCKENDMISVKGFITSEKKLVVEKVSFLQSRKLENED